MYIHHRFTHQIWPLAGPLFSPSLSRTHTHTITSTHPLVLVQAITDPEAQWNRMVELNVQEQCINLFANPIVQRKQARYFVA
jgi:hypothetical protein